MEQMNFDTFVENVKEGMEAVYADREVGARVMQQLTEKMQGQSYTSLTVIPTDSNVGVCVNMDAMYPDYLAGKSIDEIVASAVDVADDALGTAPVVNGAMLADYEQSKGMLILEAVGTKYNEDRLQDMPHIQREDLSLICRLQYDEDGHMTSLVTNRMMDIWGISQEQLFADAMENATVLRPIKVSTLTDVISETGALPGNVDDSSMPPVYVVTNENMTFGAAAVFYPGFMEQFAEHMGGDYFILPSSVHEVLIMPDDGKTRAADLAEMVSSANETVVDMEERLSDHAYHFDAKEGLFETAEHFEERMAAREELDAADKFSVLDDLRTKKEQSPIKAAPETAHKHKVEQTL